MSIDKYRSSVRYKLSAEFILIYSMTVDIDKEKSIYRQAQNGELYALIPYKTHIVLLDQKTVDDNNVVIAVQLDGKWYFIDIEKPINLKALQVGYPQFADVDVSMPESDQ